MNKGKVKFLQDHLALSPTQVVFKKDQIVELYKESFPPQILFPASQSGIKFGQHPTPIYHTEWLKGNGSGFYIGAEEVEELEPIRGKWTNRGVTGALSLGTRKNQLIVVTVLFGVLFLGRWLIAKTVKRFQKK